MKRVSHALAASLLGVALAAPLDRIQAAELQVIAGSGIAVPLQEIAAAFEKATGHTVTIRYGTAPQLVAMATSGDRVDLCVVPREVFKSAEARARFTPGDTPDVARIGVGVAVQVGAPKPDIGTPEALKQTLLNARAIASIPASATGVQLADVYQRLGIAEEMKARIKAQPAPGRIAEAVASGEADLAVFILNVLTDPRLDVVGPFPGDLKREVVYTAAPAVNAVEPQAAAAFIAHLLSPAAAAVIKSKGMTAG